MDVILVALETRREEVLDGPFLVSVAEGATARLCILVGFQRQLLPYRQNRR